jgi:hypothetical protein
MNFVCIGENGNSQFCTVYLCFSYHTEYGYFINRCFLSKLSSNRSGLKSQHRSQSQKPNVKVRPDVIVFDFDQSPAPLWRRYGLYGPGVRRDTE